jgi:hypothetical protein
MIINELHLRVKQEQYRDRQREAEKARLIRQLAGDKRRGPFQVGWLLLAALLIYNLL